MLNVVIIDNDYTSYHFEDVSLDRYYEVRRRKVVQCQSPVSDKITHGTLCAKILSNGILESDKLIFSYINIGQNNSRQLNIEDLLIALEWCELNSIHLINLSLGTQNHNDFIKLNDLCNRMVEKGATILASGCNTGGFTLPACNSKVIGVSLEKTDINDGFMINRGIDVICKFKRELRFFSNFNELFLLVESNSYVTPVITAMVAEMLCRSPRLSKDQILYNLENMDSEIVEIVGTSLRLNNMIDYLIKFQNTSQVLEIPVVWINKKSNRNITYYYDLYEKLSKSFFVVALSNDVMKFNFATEIAISNIDSFDLMKVYMKYECDLILILTDDLNLNNLDKMIGSIDVIVDCGKQMMMSDELTMITSMAMTSNELTQKIIDNFNVV